MRTYMLALAATLFQAGALSAASLDGTFTGEIARFGDSQFSRVTLTTVGGKLSGAWGATPLQGSVRGDAVEITFGATRLTGTAGRPDASGGGEEELRGTRQAVTWKLSP